MNVQITLRSGIRVRGTIVGDNGGSIELDDPDRCFHRNIDRRAIAAVRIED